MMEHLLEKAGKLCDQAEVYASESRGDRVSFENGQLKDVESSFQYGLSLRIIRDNVLGFAYTQNLADRDELIQNALDSLKGGVEGSFRLPLTERVPSLDTFDASLDTLTNSALVGESARICDLLSQKTKGQINVSANRSVHRKRLMNSSGSDLGLRSSAYVLNARVLYPYSSASLHRPHVAKTFKRVPDEYLDHLAGMYNQSVREAMPDRRRLKVLFLPETVYVLMWRLQNAVNGMSIYQKTSPLAGKLGEKIFDEKLTVVNDPLNDSLPGARAFDDEGTLCSRFPLVEHGVLRNFCYDLYFASKLKTVSSGHGFKGSFSSKPLPSLNHLVIMPGSRSFSEIVQSVDFGIIVAGALGAHSGNIPNGDFSVGVSPALYIEKGEITGHIKDVMVAGNIYHALSNIVEVENTLYPSFGGEFPALLLDNVHVTCKT